MAMASILQFSITLLFSTSALANSATASASPAAVLDKQVSIECTEVSLEFSVGGVVRGTKSKDCTEKLQAGNATSPAKSRNHSITDIH